MATPGSPPAARRLRPRAGLAGALAGLALGQGLSGCASAPANPPPLPLAVPAAYAAAVATATPSAPSATDGAWWQMFADPTLDTLVAQAQQHNPQIERAAARLAQARALLRGTQAQRAPQLGAIAGASRQSGPIVNAAGENGTLITAGLGLSWELDLFGRLAQAGEAALQDSRQRAALLKATRLLVQADTTQTYLALRAAEADAALLQASLDAQRAGLRLLEGQQRAGLLASAALGRARADLAAAEAEAPVLARQRAQLRHALALLLGQPAPAFPGPAATGGAPETLPVVPAGLPSAMLARRPDVAAAQAAVQAAQARRGEAQAAWFPSIGLTATAGAASPDLAQLLQASMRTWGLAALLTVPLLDGGRREAGLQRADADLAEAVAGWREQMLLALREVEDQLVALQTLGEQAAWQARAQAESREAVAQVASRQRNGLASQLDLLAAQQQALARQRLLLRVQADQRQATVALVRALGGAWDPVPAAQLARAGG